MRSKLAYTLSRHRPDITIRTRTLRRLQLLVLLERERATVARQASYPPTTKVSTHAMPIATTSATTGMMSMADPTRCPLPTTAVTAEGKITHLRLPASQVTSGAAVEMTIAAIPARLNVRTTTHAGRNLTRAEVSPVFARGSTPLSAEWDTEPSVPWPEDSSETNSAMDSSLLRWELLWERWVLMRLKLGNGTYRTNTSLHPCPQPSMTPVDPRKPLAAQLPSRREMGGRDGGPGR